MSSVMQRAIPGLISGDVIFGEN